MNTDLDLIDLNLTFDVVELLKTTNKFLKNVPDSLKDKMQEVGSY